MYTFNLIDQPWIPVRVGGKLALYSLERTLLEARTIERIEDASPLVIPTLHRLLLAVLYRSVLYPPLNEMNRLDELGQWFVEGFPEERIRTYLERWKFRFDLFDEKRPFYQRAGYENKLKSIAQLAAERSSGTNKLLFDHTLEENPPEVGAAEAARLLIARQMLAIPEGAGYSPSPLGGTAIVLPLGNNLLETLCLNLMPYFPSADDLPVWETEKLQPDAEQIILGMAHRLTWVSRLVRLEPSGNPQDPQVRSLHYYAACKLKEGATPNPDPMLAYRISDEKTGERRAVGFRKDRALWRSFTALLPHKGDDLAPRVIGNALSLLRHLGQQQALQTTVLGATNDKAKFEFWRTERHILPEALTSDREEDVYGSVTWALEAAKGLGDALNGAARALAKGLLARGEREPHKDDVTRRASALPAAAMYWSALEGAFAQLLSKLTPEYDAPQVEAFWLEQMLAASRRAWEKTREAAGDDAYALRAIYGAEGILARAQRKFGAQLKEKREML